MEIISSSESMTSTIFEDNIIARAEAVDVHDVFQCNICMDRPTNSVLTSCGHLFCWSCLHRWLQNQPKPCPVCKIVLKPSSIIPVYGSQKESSASRVDDSIPPRPSAPSTEATSTEATQPSRSDDTANTSIGSNFTETVRRFFDPILRVHISWFQRARGRREHTESLMPLLRLDALRSRARTDFRDALRSRAQADFREIRAWHPPSWIGWIAEASHEFAREFDPSRVSVQDGATGYLHLFIFYVLVPQGEYVPGVDDFRRSWLPYYEARDAGLSLDEYYMRFLEGWARHFRAAWSRAGEPDTFANATEAPVECVLPSATSSTEVGAVAAASHERSASGGESEVEEIDAMAYQRALQHSGQFNRRFGRESSRANRRRRPY